MTLNCCSARKSALRPGPHATSRARPLGNRGRTFCNQESTCHLVMEVFSRQRSFHFRCVSFIASITEPLLLHEEHRQQSQSDADTPRYGQLLPVKHNRKDDGDHEVHPGDQGNSGQGTTL